MSFSRSIAGLVAAGAVGAAVATTPSSIGHLSRAAFHSMRAFSIAVKARVSSTL